MTWTIDKSALIGFSPPQSAVGMAAALPELLDDELAAALLALLLSEFPGTPPGAALLDAVKGWNLTVTLQW